MGKSWSFHVRCARRESSYKERRGREEFYIVIYINSFLKLVFLFLFLFLFSREIYKYDNLYYYASFNYIEYIIQVLYCTYMYVHVQYFIKFKPTP